MITFGRLASKLASKDLSTGGLSGRVSWCGKIVGNMKPLKEFLRLAVIVIIIGLGVGYALAAWNPPGFSPPTGPGSPAADLSVPVG